jgi:hypothetical protein
MDRNHIALGALVTVVVFGGYMFLSSRQDSLPILERKQGECVDGEQKNGCEFDLGFLPPDPGEAGKATLEGIDADGDGLRDDIQRYIALTYPESESTRAALRQYAITSQKTLLEADSREASLTNADIRQDAWDCLHYVQPNDARVVRVELRAEILNTEERSIAWVKADQHLSGQVFFLTPDDEMKAKCNFDPDAMEN